MVRHFLLYWKFNKVAYHFYGTPLNHLAHDALKKVQAGDVLWIVTSRSGDLLLAGRLAVGQVLDATQQSPPSLTFPSKASRWHVLAATDSAEPMQLINLNELALSLSLRFHSPSDRLRINRQGRLNVMSLYHLRRLTDDSAALLNYVWQDSKEALWTEQPDIWDDAEPNLVIEGKPTLQIRMARQRNSALAGLVKRQVLESGGELRCEVCGMSFAETYGELGEGYIEVHHPNPLSEMSGEQLTDIEGLVMLCANCHRMAHRKSPPYTIEELRAAMRQNQTT